MKYAKILNLINQANDEAWEELDLSSQGLVDLPHEVGSLTNLKILNLDDNNLCRLPKEIGNLTKLKILSLDGSQIEELPLEIGNLHDLYRLDLDWNHLTYLPAEFSQLQNLVELDLDANKFTDFPIEITCLKKLKLLCFCENRIRSLPKEIKSISSLEILHLSNNNLESLPREICELDKLRELYLRNNYLKDLPDNIERLNSLKRFVISGNFIEIPPEVIEWGGTRYEDGFPDRIIAYYSTYVSSRDTRRLRSFNEAKVLVLGEASVGKTSLIKQLIHRQDCKSLTSKTIGIEISKWNIRLVRFTPPKTVCLKFWDFGGQEIMHATHQFFLTKRSVYILVINSRQNHVQNRIEYWLRIIQAFGGDSPILIVSNQNDKNIQKLDEFRLRADYPQIQSILYTSCFTGQGINSLEEEITCQVAKLKHVHEDIPLSYLKVKESLEKAAIDKNYIPYEEYIDICCKNGISESTLQEILLNLLHDLGIILNYKNDPRLCETSVLNPTWITGAVYKILNDHILSDRADGQLSYMDLHRILPNQKIYPIVKYHFLTSLMEEFELCFPIAPATFLLPEMLSSNEPDTSHIDFSGALRFRYVYSRVLPPNIICRFIVRNHYLIYKSFRWRNGVVLSDKSNNLAIVRSNSEDRFIEILVQGKLRRYLLEIIRNEFDHIHGTIKGIQFQEEVDVSGKGKVWELYPYLVELEREGEKTWRPRSDPRRKYNIRQILDGFEPLEKREKRYSEENKVYINIENSMSGNQKEIFMGDKFERISNSTIINRSSVENAFNRTQESINEDTADAIVEVAEFVEESQNAAAGLVLNSFMEELGKPKTDKGKLRQCWDGLQAILPDITNLAEACATIGQLFV